MKTLTLDDYIFLALCLFSATLLFSVTVMQAAMLLALLLLLVKRHRDGTLRGLWRELASHQLFIPWMFYLAVCILTSLTAYYPHKGLGQFNSDQLKYVCLSTLLLTVAWKHLPRLSAILMAAAAVSALFGIYEALSPIAAGEPPVRAGVLMNAVRYGEAMALTFFLPFCLAAIPPAGADRRLRPLCSAAALLTLCALVLSQTRGAWLGLLAGLAVMFVAAPAARKKVALLAGGMLLAAALAASMSAPIRARFSAIAELAQGRVSSDQANYGVSVRLELWKLGWKMLNAHPVVGIGPDNVRKVFKKFHPEPFPEEGIYGTLHSIYIHQAAERGLLGLGALLFLFLAMLRYAYGLYRATASPYALWALCALPVFYVVNLTEISFQHAHTSFTVFLALAFAAAARQETA